MMIFLIVFLAILLAILGAVFLIYIWIRSMLRKHGIDKSVTEIYKESKHAEMLDSKRHKNVSGMTNVLLPTIRTSFPEFNQNEFYVMVEKSLRNIFMALENKDISYIKDNQYSLIRDKMELQIKDLEENDIKYKFDDIVFHAHAIKDYKKTSDIATITISSSLEYYYTETKGNSEVKKDKYKKQTRYQTQFVYIYDVVKAGFDLNLLGLNCPQCGAPIKSYEQKECPYCKAGINIQIANVTKVWRLANYKEDY